MAFVYALSVGVTIDEVEYRLHADRRQLFHCLCEMLFVRPRVLLQMILSAETFVAEHTTIGPLASMDAFVSG